MASEYSVHVWTTSPTRPNFGHILAQWCVGSSSDRINTAEEAAKWGHRRAIRERIIEPTERCQIDIAEDASDDWLTFEFPETFEDEDGNADGTCADAAKTRGWL